MRVDRMLVLAALASVITWAATEESSEHAARLGVVRRLNEVPRADVRVQTVRPLMGPRNGPTATPKPRR
jgi:hypothetical protein